MNRKIVLEKAGVMTTITMFVTAVFLLLLSFSGGAAFRVAEISIPFVFFGVNFFLLAVPGKKMPKTAFRILLLCVNLALTAGSAILLLKL